jgi:tripartite-type tricarboxylate transporter receptor subunit TctC
VVTRLGGAIRAITELSEVEQRMSPLGFRLDYRPAQEFRELIASEHQRYGDVIRAAGIAPN